MLEDICINLDTAKKLVEAGVVIECVFKHYRELDMLYGIVRGKYWNIGTAEEIEQLKRTSDKDIDLVYPAPTVEEIWHLLPQYIDIDDETYWLSQEPGNAKGITLIRYMTIGCKIIKEFSSDSICEILAQMLLWLKKGDYLE